MARLDKYIAKLNGKEGDIPAPVSTLDKEMQTLAENPPSGGGFIYLECTDDNHIVTIPMKAGELYEAMKHNVVTIKYTTEGATDAPFAENLVVLVSASPHNAGYYFYPTQDSFLTYFLASTANDYPTNSYNP